MTPGPIMQVETLYQGLKWVQLLGAVLMVVWGLRTKDRFARPFLPMGVYFLASSLGFFLRNLVPEGLLAATLLLGMVATTFWFVRLLRQARKAA